MPNVNSEILDRLPPSSLDAERAVLGSVLLVPDVLDELAGLLSEEDFYADAHTRTFRAMQYLQETGRRCDWALLEEVLKSWGCYEEVGGRAFIATIAQCVPTAANAVHYAQIVREKSLQRQCIMAATETLRDAYDGDMDARALLARSQERLFSIHDAKSLSALVPLHNAIAQAFDELEKMSHGECVGVSTGLDDLDHLIAGLVASELYILAARPGMGKSALALNIAAAVAKQTKDAGDTSQVLFVTLEMSRLELAQRMLCTEAAVSSYKWRSGFLTHDDRASLTVAQSTLAQLPLLIDDSAARTVMEIAAHARRVKRRQGLSLLIVDYLQLLDADISHRRGETRQEEVAKISRRMKTLAKELDVPVLGVCQLSRASEDTKDSRPRLSHLRESGALEQDADCVMFVYRPWYYFTAAERNMPAMQNKRHLAELIVAKQRHGPTGTVNVHWNETLTLFRNLSHHEQDEQSGHGHGDFD